MIEIFGIPYLLKGRDILLDNEQSLDKETKARSDRFSKETKVEAATIRNSQNRNGELFQSYQRNYNLNTTPQNDTIFTYNIPNIYFQYNSDGVTGRKSYLYQDKKKGIIKHGITYDGTLPEDILKYKLFGLDLLKIIQNNKVSFKKGGGIHIKKKNRGKFTEYCGGKVTDECILKAKKSKNPKLRKRATFAANSRRWSKKHEEGAKIHKPFGHRAITDNGWLSTKLLKNLRNVYGL